jgi:hypothetical protein
MAYNNCVRKARRVIERVFGILKKKFRLLTMACESLPLKKMRLTWCCVLLHNLMTRRRLLLPDQAHRESPEPEVQETQDSPMEDLSSESASGLIQRMIDEGRKRRYLLMNEITDDGV